MRFGRNVCSFGDRSQLYCSTIACSTYGQFFLAIMVICDNISWHHLLLNPPVIIRYLLAALIVMASLEVKPGGKLNMTSPRFRRIYAPFWVGYICKYELRIAQPTLTPRSFLEMFVRLFQITSVGIEEKLI